MHIPEKDVPGVLESFRERTKDAMAALIAGEKTFKDGDNRISSADGLAGSVEMLLCLQADDHVRLLLSALQEKGLDHAYHLVHGESLEFQGQLDQAAEAYKQAALCEPADALPLRSLGSVYLKKQDHEHAKMIYEKALALAEDRVPVLSELITVYEALKDQGKLAETYEECFKLVPDLHENKKLVKAYKRACKKAGREPAV
jgi:tetratricopeptide (TPR) repeat protein